MKDNGALAPPSHAARAIWSLLDRDLDNGAILHVRDLT
jgi:benzil reductase ((S)-benzoin forming)